MLRLRVLPPLFALILCAPTVSAQIDLTPERFDFAPEKTYDAAIPSPENVLGYELGETFTLYADVTRYLYQLADASPRVTLHEYGRSHEGRPLHYLVITSPENHARIGEVRRSNLALADPATPAGEADRIIAENPVVTWLSYNVHGNEPSSTEAALQVAYTMAAATDAETTDLLAQTVLIIDPCINPDGRDRYAYWYRSAQRSVISTSADEYEHDEPWPGGRTNHYWFDLNRDWVWLVHPESQGRIAAYGEWLPQVHVDYHEQGFDANYFTMPGQPPRNLLLPADQERWATMFGDANARAFDARRINYFTRESFDFFYPGYGSSYPSLMGGIGMLTEQGGHSRGGRAVETEDGYVLTFRQRIFDHFTTSLATIEAAVEHRTELLGYSRAFFDPENTRANETGYLIADDGGHGYAYDVIDMLLAHGVHVERLADEVTTTAADYLSGSARRQAIPAGTFVVPTDQARHVFVNTVLGRNLAIEDSVMYDMATWSAPLAYNLEAWYTTGTVPRGDTVTEAPAPEHGVSGERGYAWVVDWSQRHAPKALSALWNHGYRVRAARKAFTHGDRTYPPGTLIVLEGRNLERLDQIAQDMEAVAAQSGVRIEALATGRMDAGIDLASRHSRPVERPKAGLVLDAPFSSYTAGQLWYLFDQESEFGIERLRSTSLPRIDLAEYDVLVLPGASRLASVFDSTQVDRLRRWIAAGGTLVATENSATALKGLGIGRADAIPGVAPEDRSNERFYTSYEARSDSSGLRRIPGSALNGRLDATHPLAFGVGETLYSLKFSTTALEPSDALQTVGWYHTDPAALLASGYASHENLQRLAGKAFAGVESLGQGQIVYLVDNTQYRMFWVGPARMVQNAVMLLPGLL